VRTARVVRTFQSVTLTRVTDDAGPRNDTGRTRPQLLSSDHLVI